MKPSEQIPPPNLFDTLGSEAAIKTRIDQLRSWLRENGYDCQREQKHLDEGTPERIYWHYGYLSALVDILRQLQRQHRRLN